MVGQVFKLVILTLLLGDFLNKSEVSGSSGLNTFGSRETANAIMLFRIRSRLFTDEVFYGVEYNKPKPYYFIDEAVS
jgi:hypothetical protein